jgi:hypothetical protein
LGQADPKILESSEWSAIGALIIGLEPVRNVSYKQKYY